MNDLELMRLAIEEAKKSEPEDTQHRPRVGVVIARDGVVIAQAHRNQDKKGSHAEYLALKELEKRGEDAKGATVYTTLEPCVYRRKSDKIPCAKRLIDAGVSRVFWGMIDPHKTVKSEGILQLRANQIETGGFPHELVLEIEALNKDFKDAFTAGTASPEFIETNQGRSLDDWYRTLNRIYWRQNLNRTPAELFAHLVETIGGISSSQSGKAKPGASPKSFVVKALSWWFALCGRLNVRSVEEMIWAKFPYACAYCQAKPHADICKSKGETPNWTQLRELGSGAPRPSSLGGWQRMFREIYPNVSQLPVGDVHTFLAEELGELAEAVRAFEVFPGLFLNEAPDVFAWILQLQNSIDVESSEPGTELQRSFCEAFPDLCTYCAAETCQCPATLPSTVGRLGGAIPPTEYIDGEKKIKAFMTVDESARFFGL